MKKFLPVIGLLVCLSACSSDEPRPLKQDSDFSPKINLDVLNVEIVDRTDPLGNGAGSTYALNNLKPTLADAMRSWAADKIRAVGTTGEAIIVIRNASLKQEPLHYTDDWFTRQQASKFEGHAEMEIDVSGRSGHGQIEAGASHFETLPEDATSQERQDAYTKLLNAMMHDLSNNVRRGVHDHLGAFVITGPVAP